MKSNRNWVSIESAILTEMMAGPFTVRLFHRPLLEQGLTTSASGGGRAQWQPGESRSAEAADDGRFILAAIASAANSAAGAAYCAAIIADIYNGYRFEIPDHYFTNVKRAVDAACEIEGLNDIIQSDLQSLLKQVERDGLTDYSPIDKSQMENGFGDSAEDA